MKNSTAGRLLAVVIGLGIILGGVYFLTIAPVECQDKVMHPGDVCKAGRKQPSGPYEKMRGTQHMMGWVAVGIGSAVIIGVIVSMTGSNRPGPAAPPPYSPPGPPGWGAGPYRPPPHYPPPPPGPYPPPPGNGPYHPPPPGR